MKKLLIIPIVLICVSSLFAQTAASGNEAELANKHAVKLYQEGDYEQALSEAKRATQLYSEGPEKDKGPAAVALTNLGYIHLKLDNKTNANDAFAAALHIYEALDPLGSADAKKFASLLETVALFDAFDKDLSKAGVKLNRALQIREKFDGPNAAETAETLGKLAQIYRVSGDYEKALPLLMRSIDISAAKVSTTVSAEKIFMVVCMLDTLGKNDESREFEKKFTVMDNEPVAAGSQNLLISGGQMAKKAKHLPPPDYTKALRSGKESRVDVRVLVSEEGKTLFACAVSGRKEFYDVSERAAYKATFSPTILGGHPAKVLGYVSYMFTR